MGTFKLQERACSRKGRKNQHIAMGLSAAFATKVAPTGAYHRTARALIVVGVRKVQGDLQAKKSINHCLKSPGHRAKKL